MCAERHRARKRRPRQPAPETLPDDLFDYAEELTPDGRERRSQHIAEFNQRAAEADMRLESFTF